MPRTASPIPDELKDWFLLGNPRCSEFWTKCQSKINAKWRGADKDQKERNEKRHDLISELSVAKALLGEPFFGEVEYEPQKEGGPDFHVVGKNGLEFSVEVTRIHRTGLESGMDSLENKLFHMVKGINGQFGVSINLLGDHSAEPCALKDAIMQVIDRRDDVVEMVRKTIKENGPQLAPEEVRNIKLGIVRGLDIETCLHHLPGKDPDSSAAWFGGLSSIPYTQFEHVLLGDVVRKKLRQMQTDIPNVIVILLDSDTIDARELLSAFYKGCFRITDGGDVTPFLIWRNELLDRDKCVTKKRKKLEKMREELEKLTGSSKMELEDSIKKLENSIKRKLDELKEKLGLLTAVLAVSVKWLAADSLPVEWRNPKRRYPLDDCLFDCLRRCIGRVALPTMI